MRFIAILILSALFAVSLHAQTEIGLVTKKSLAKFDYSSVKDKKILIYLKPYKGERKFSANANVAFFPKRKSVTSEERIAAWKEGFEKSDYSASSFEITHDLAELKALIKKRDSRYLFMRTSDDDYGNIYMKVFAVHPKQMVVANVLTNQFDLTAEGDIRLMFNLLDAYFEDANEIQSKGLEKRKEVSAHVLNKFSNELERLEEMTLLVPLAKHKNKQKADKINKDIKDALKEHWDVCPYKIVDAAEIEQKRAEKATGYFYWRPLILNPKASMIKPLVYHYILTTQNDALIAAVMTSGGYKLKAKSVEKVQDGIRKLEAHIKRKNK